MESAKSKQWELRQTTQFLQQKQNQKTTKKNTRKTKRNGGAYLLNKRGVKYIKPNTLYELFWIHTKKKERRKRERAYEQKRIPTTIAET